MAVQTYDPTDIYMKLSNQADSLMRLNDRFTSYTADMRTVPERLDRLDHRMDRMEQELLLTTSGVRELNEWRLRADAALDAIGAKLGANEKRFDSIDTRFDGIDKKLADHDVQLGRIQTRQTAHDVRFDRVEARLTAHDVCFERVEQHLRDHDKRLDGIDRRLEAHDKRFDDIDQTLADHGQRFDDLDNRLDEMLETLLAEIRKGR